MNHYLHGILRPREHVLRFAYVSNRGASFPVWAWTRYLAASRCFLAWAEQRGIRLIHIQLDKPTQNSFIKSFELV
jgi:hypothetical protein